ncbi:MAG: KpsF/GutQ family sugar-phosphate isomerase [Myxococcota bacterium]
MARPKLRPVDSSPRGRDSASAQLAWARTVLENEAKAIASLSARVELDFLEAVEAIHRVKGRVVVTAIGKPGFIAQKLSATLSSVGVPSLYLHPAEAAHGDLGRVARGDVVIALSNSGATEELLRLVGPLKRLEVTLIVITGDKRSPLARGADVVVDIGPIDEACPMGLVPTASSAALHAVCDALAMTVAWRREFTAAEYARFHPGGKLGRSVMLVKELMRSGEANPLVRDTATLAEVVVVMTNTPGRPGAANVVDAKGRLKGIFTDGDLRRLAEKRALDLKTKVRDVMARQPRCVGPDELVLTAAALMREAKIDQVPVVDREGCAVGLLDVQDLLAARVV